MKAISIRLPASQNVIDIYAIADVHMGDANCRLDKLTAEIEHVRDTPNAYMILNGDLLNWASKTSISDTYGETLSPMEEITKICNLLEPVKDKILAMTPGNHEERAYRNEGIDIMALVAKQLGISDRYSNASAVLFLHIGHGSHGMRDRQTVFTIFINHGRGGGRKLGGKVNRVEEMSSIVDADVYIHSHTHEPFMFPGQSYRASAKSDSISLVKKLFVNTASYLEYGGYGETNEYRPNSIDSPVITLTAVPKTATATIKLLMTDK